MIEYLIELIIDNGSAITAAAGHTGIKRIKNRASFAVQLIERSWLIRISTNPNIRHYIDFFKQSALTFCQGLNLNLKLCSAQAISMTVSANQR
ncbi:hypothetical protein, partial [Candidatus Electronema sp. JM]|uniref:hypothetical protein n=1 Tax=Candidatus Electronema sp. JM TaxID=3401571 RepID=UPI003AA89371